MYQTKNKCLYLHNNDFCVVFKSEGLRLKQAAEEVKNNFYYQNKVVSNDNLKKVILYSFELEKLNNQLNLLAFDFETFKDAENAVPYAGAFYSIFKLNMNSNRDSTNEEIENVRESLVKGLINLEKYNQ